MLRKIVAQKKKEVEQLYARTSIADMERQIASLSPCRSLAARFMNRNRPVGVIAEVKKASPSRGLIRDPFEPLSIARAYEAADVEGMSVLTDETFFQGSLAYLQQIRESLQAPIPLLRKDFIIDPLQLYEARAYGADVVLLIAAILDRRQLRTLAEEAKALGLETLVEVHTVEELATVLDAVTPDLLGVNNRDLQTFQTSLHTTFALLENLPDSLVTISESGVHAPEQIERLAQAGLDGVLVGEHFMRQSNIEEAVYELVGSGRPIMEEQR
ncbi:indole-3-glycerol phosphate synthase TrpC [Aneurinibacillus sp. BA2021]|nr:indole-3-glycerol phosphate synthase TrpC [Aneurinibacillus sp. BA2021]